MNLLLVSKGKLYLWYHASDPCSTVKSYRPEVQCKRTTPCHNSLEQPSEDKDHCLIFFYSSFAMEPLTHLNSLPHPYTRALTSDEIFLQGLFWAGLGSAYRTSEQLSSNYLRSCCSSARCYNGLCQLVALFNCRATSFSLNHLPWSSS